MRIEEWQERFQDELVEVPLFPVRPYSDHKSIILSDGLDPRIGADGQSCSVELLLADDPQVICTIAPDSTTAHESANDGVVAFARDGNKWTAQTVRISRNTRLINHAEYLLPDVELVRVRLDWIALPSVRARGRIATDDACWCGRLQFSAECWKITLDKYFDDRSEAADKDAADYRPTHTMEMCRADGRPFDVATVKVVLECLRVSFSFAFGRWCAFVAPTGFDSHGHIAWEEWFAPVIEQPRNVEHAWVHPSNDEELIAFIKRALPRFLAEGISGTTRFQMISAIAAVKTGFVEQRLLAAFSALESIQWTLLVLGGDITQREFKDMPGADRLKATLEKAEISPSLDGIDLPALTRFMASSRSTDAATALVRVRNRLVHPRNPSDEIYRLDNLMIEASMLARHYLNLLILFSLGYQGRYVRMLPPFGWATHTMPVPWTKDDV